MWPNVIITLLLPPLFLLIRARATGCARSPQPHPLPYSRILSPQPYAGSSGRDRHCLTGCGRCLRNRSHFFTFAARAMRRLLVDHARRKQAGKRIEPADRIPLDRTPELAVEPDADVLAVQPPVGL
ncbi:MAG: hypothetical protein GY835_27565 [bacterium]|nr:hypothetical protein [bacterium]